MTIARQKLGKLGEDLAVGALLARGYAVLDRRYRTRHGEIDIVADDGGTHPPGRDRRDRGGPL
ncbi:MAG: YraN family protein, partial [Vicinamibacterales bacterium]